MGLITAIEGVNTLVNHQLSYFGIYPRTIEGLIGILTCPFLHSNSTHLVSNVLPLGVFMVFVMQHGIARFWYATAIIMGVGGGLVWLLGREAIHIGASGLIFGYFSFLVIAGIRSRDLKLIAIAIAVGFGYGGILLQLNPTQVTVSWEAHLFGLIAGVLAAAWLESRRG